MTKNKQRISKIFSKHMGFDEVTPQMLSVFENMKIIDIAKPLVLIYRKKGLSYGMIAMKLGVSKRQVIWIIRKK